jgi:ribonuclease P protein subunit POP4
MNGRFETYVPLHRLWLGYISELLGLGPQPSGAVTEQNAAMPNVPTIHAKLVKADFHGSIMTGAVAFIGLDFVANQ